MKTVLSSCGIVVAALGMVAGCHRGQLALLASIRRFVTLLRQRNYAYEFHVKPGGHYWNE